MDEKEETPDASRESIEEASAIAGGCMEMGDAGVTADEALEAEEGFLAEKIRRAQEWQNPFPDTWAGMFLRPFLF